MTEIIILVGTGLCALSVVMAIIAVAQTRAPRGAAIALVLGIAALFGGAMTSQEPFNIDAVTGAWQNLLAGKISLTPDPVTAPAPEAAPDASPAPATEPAPEAVPEAGNAASAPAGTN